MKKMRQYNNIRLFVCLVLLGICWAVVVTTIGTQFKTAGNPDSVDAFLTNFRYIFFVHLVLILIWWGFLLAPFTSLAPIRTKLEMHTSICCFFFCALAFAFTTLLYFHNHIISGASGRYKLQCAFILPCFYTGLMYALPPVHVSYVTLPGRKFLYGIIRFVVVAASFFVAGLLFYQNFIGG